MTHPSLSSRLSLRSLRRVIPSMPRVASASLALGLAMGASLAASSEAHAGFEECGGAHVERGADCELRYETSCESQCDLDAALTACAADLQSACSGQCDLSADVSCTSDCRPACEVECSANPGAFDCSASCQLDCEGSCDAQCEGSEDEGECRASCEATCSAECDVGCDVEAPDADCVAQCEGCCGGSCTADVNLGCQIDCQAEGFAACQSSFASACETQCSTDGSLFCDGQFIDYGDDPDDCIDALEAAGIRVRTSVQFDGSLVGDGCSITPGSDGSRGFGVLFVLMTLGVASTHRRRRNAA